MNAYLNRVFSLNKYKLTIFQYKMISNVTSASAVYADVFARLKRIRLHQFFSIKFPIKWPGAGAVFDNFLDVLTLH